MELTVGTVVEGRVTGITKFGAFVALPNGKSGMVHISEIANTFVQDISQHIQENQTVKVMVISIDEKGRINLSIKRAQPRENAPAQPSDQGQQRRPYRKSNPAAAPVPPPAPKTADELFEDKLRLFMQSSEDRISGLKPYHEKRGSRGRRK